MNKFLHLLFSVITIFASLPVLADEVVFIPSETPVSGQLSDHEGPDSVAIDGIQIAITNGDFTNGNMYSFYQGQTTTFSSEVGVITKIEITSLYRDMEKGGPGHFVSPSTGTYTFSDSVGVWTGSADRITFQTPAASLKASRIVVTYTRDPNAVAKPRINGEDRFLVRSVVSISAQQGDAVIHYTTDGSEPDENSAVYSGPFYIYNTVTVKALAMRGENKSSTVTAVYHLGETYTVEQAIAMIADSIAPDYPVFVEGWVQQVNSFDNFSGSMTYFITRNRNDIEPGLRVVDGMGMAGVPFSEDTKLKNKDQVIVKGKLEPVEYFDVYENGMSGSLLFGVNGVTTSLEQHFVPEEQKDDDAVFNLAGQRVDKAYKGIVVKKGKKYIRR